MNALEAIRTRRTVHKYRPGPVPDTVIEAALEAGHLAPCHKLTWPWRFTVVSGATRERIPGIALEVKLRKSRLSAEQVAALEAKVGNPGGLIVVSLRRCEAPFRAREDYAAAACAIQNMLLAIHAQGYGAKWGTGELTRAPQTYTLLGIDEAVEEIIGFVWLGVPAEVPAIPRPELSTVVRRLG